MLQKILPVIGIIIFAMLSGTVSDMSAVAANVKSNLIVLMGTFLCCLISHSPQMFVRLASDIREAFGGREAEHSGLIAQIQSLSRLRWAKGDMALDRQAKQIDNAFLRMGIEMVVDGYDRHTIFKTLERSYDNFLAEKKTQSDLMNTMIKLMPVFGFVGTIIGLIEVLNHMGSAEVIGKGLATALLTTFYGLLYANIVFLPVAKKLAEHTRTQALERALIIEGVLDIFDKASSKSIGYRLRYCIGDMAGMAPSLAHHYEEMGQMEPDMDTSVPG